LAECWRAASGEGSVKARVEWDAVAPGARPGRDRFARPGGGCRRYEDNSTRAPGRRCRRHQARGVPSRQRGSPPPPRRHAESPRMSAVVLRETCHRRSFPAARSALTGTQSMPSIESVIRPLMDRNTDGAGISRSDALMAHHACCMMPFALSPESPSALEKRTPACRASPTETETLVISLPSTAVATSRSPSPRPSRPGLPTDGPLADSPAGKPRPQKRGDKKGTETTGGPCCTRRSAAAT